MLYLPIRRVPPEVKRPIHDSQVLPKDTSTAVATHYFRTLWWWRPKSTLTLLREPARSHEDVAATIDNREHVECRNNGRGRIAIGRVPFATAEQKQKTTEISGSEHTYNTHAYS